MAPTTVDNSTTGVSAHYTRCITPSQLARCANGRRLALWAVSKRFVYILKNADVPPRYYTGLTSDIVLRLKAHNEGRNRHTAKCRPWSVDVTIEFADERRAAAFEQYLKSGSGVVFAQRHLR